jgi:hypothetical protein
MRYENERPEGTLGRSADIAYLFAWVIEALNRRGERTTDDFWPNAGQQFTKHSITLTRAACSKLSLVALTNTMAIVPRTPADVTRESWKHFTREVLAQTPKQDLYDVTRAINYFETEFSEHSNKTRASIVAMFTTTADHLLQGRMRDIFCSGRLDITPEATFDGKIILLDFPVNEFGTAGRTAQLIVKTLWQKAVLRRAISDDMRPVFLSSDESQNFITSHDQEYQPQCRDRRAATVFITQNISGYISRIGKNEAETLIGTLNTKIFHANGDPATNQWASSLLGTEIKEMRTVGRSSSLMGPTTESKSKSESPQPVLEPGEFLTLRQPDEENGVAETIVIGAGKVPNGDHPKYLRAQFKRCSLEELRSPMPHRPLVAEPEPKPDKTPVNLAFGYRDEIIFVLYSDGSASHFRTNGTGIERDLPRFEEIDPLELAGETWIDPIRFRVAYRDYKEEKLRIKSWATWPKHVEIGGFESSVLSNANSLNQSFLPFSTGALFSFSPQCDVVYTADCGDLAIRRWSTTTGDPLDREKRPGAPNILLAPEALSCFAVSKNENVIVSANPRRIALWKPGTQLAVFDQVHHTSRVVVSDNELFVAGLSHGATNLWVINVATKKLRVLLQGPHFTSVRFFPDDALVAAGDSDGVVRIFDTRSGEQLVAVGCGKSIMALATATNLIGATYGDYPFARAVPTGNWSMWAIQTTTGGMQLRSIK